MKTRPLTVRPGGLLRRHACRPARCCLAVLAGALFCGAAPAAAEEREALPSAVWRRPGQVFVVELAGAASVGARQFAAVQHYVIGVAALPVAVLQPPVAVGLPFYLLFAAPWQSVFNARAATLARVLVAEPLPDAVVGALRAQWDRASPPLPPLQVTLRLAGYGLATPSGRVLEAFEDAEDLCLVADGRLEIARADGAPLLEDIAVGPHSGTPDAPPPLCAPLSRWAADDGRLLHGAAREMAELLAAFIVDRLERRP